MFLGQEGRNLSASSSSLDTALKKESPTLKDGSTQGYLQLVRTIGTHESLSSFDILCQPFELSVSKAL